MNNHEFDAWCRLTAKSAYHWMDDSVTRLNGRGRLFYTGGEQGFYMQLLPTGDLIAGTYEGARPHIGEAAFQPVARHHFATLDEALQKACELGGAEFMVDVSGNGKEVIPKHSCSQHLC